MTAPGKRPSKRELRAMAYAIADEIETRAGALMAANPRLDWRAATALAVAAMAKD